MAKKKKVVQAQNTAQKEQAMTLQEQLNSDLVQKLNQAKKQLLEQEKQKRRRT